MFVCEACGSEFEQAKHGRPRKRCQRCSPPRVPPQGRVQVAHECACCGESFVAGKLAKYCSDRCRQLGNRSQPCTGCGELMMVSRSSSDEPYCLTCRRAGLAPTRARHGESRYRAGCRCGVCRKAVADRQREYARKRAREGRTIRTLVGATCETCAVPFLARKDTAARFCSMECAGNLPGQVTKRRRKIPTSVRRRVYERDGWACQLCESPVRADEDSNHPRYPTLDHVVPYSKGGSDDQSNLRLACRQCNVRRGTNEDWVPVEGVA